MQEGMLFHSLYAPESGVGVEQVVGALAAPLDPVAFAHAWQRTVGRHPALRTAFRWHGLERPVQDVHSHVACPVHLLHALDWPAARWDAWLRSQRRRGFDLARPPLMRLALVRRGPLDQRLVWTYHHALLDSHAAARVLREALGRCTGAPPPSAVASPSPAPPGPPDLRAARAFWRRALAGVDRPTPLVVDRPSPGPGAGAGTAGADTAGADIATLDLAFTPEETQDLRARLAAHDLTLATLVQAAWALLLARYSRARDVVFGVSASTREAATRDAVGLFINTLPLRVPVPPEAPVLPWLRDVAARWAQVRAHRHTPLANIQAWLDRGARFESLLVLEPRAFDADLGEWGTFELRGRTSYPLVATATLAPRLRLDVQYQRARFDSAAVHRLVGHLRTLLQGLAEGLGPAPEAARRLHAVPLLTEDERSTLLHGWNATATEVGTSGACIHRRFEAQAARTPDAVAVVAGEARLTYRQLNARANRVAHRLRRWGVGPETPVALCVDRSAAMVVGLLAVLKAGGAYVPIDPAYPPARRAFMIDDAGASVLLTRRELRDTLELPDPAPRVLCLDAAADVAAEPATNPEGGAAGDNRAYVIYTSGSTGRPKGVAIRHEAVINLVATTQPTFAFGPDDVWTVFHSYAFDFSVWEIWTPLLTGGRLVVVPLELTRSPAAFYDLLRRERVTVLNQTPSAVRGLLPLHAADAGLALRLLVCGGEALPPALARELLGWGVPLWNFYGPTEATVWATCYPVTAAAFDAAQDAEVEAVPIGRPLPNVRVYVLDAYLNPVPVGVPGELHIGGAGLARGYHRRPGLTAARFVPDPFGGEPGARLYKTGDLARYRPDGSVAYLGRMDDQVKLRGFRVELGEIEATLDAHPAVAQAVVVAREARLVAYWIAADAAAPPTVEVLRRHLAARLPAYMVPAAFVRLDAMPLTPNGKLDRRALPAPDAARPELGAAYVSPRTPIERALCEIWQQVLGVDRVGVRDNFFALGGDSIRSLRIVAQAQAAGWALSPREVFERPTVAELAAVARPAEAAVPAPAAARPSPTSGPDGYTPEDFPEAGLNQEELNDLLAELGEASS
jgi:amino acid adenylation domain-containing protein